MTWTGSSRCSVIWVSHLFLLRMQAPSCRRENVLQSSAWDAGQSWGSFFCNAKLILCVRDICTQIRCVLCSGSQLAQPRPWRTAWLLLPHVWLRQCGTAGGAVAEPRAGAVGNDRISGWCCWTGTSAGLLSSLLLKAGITSRSCQAAQGFAQLL